MIRREDDTDTFSWNNINKNKNNNIPPYQQQPHTNAPEDDPRRRAYYHPYATNPSSSWWERRMSHSNSGSSASSGNILSTSTSLHYYRDSFTLFASTLVCLLFGILIFKQGKRNTHILNNYYTTVQFSSVQFSSVQFLYSRVLTSMQYLLTHSFLNYYNYYYYTRHRRFPTLVPTTFSQRPFVSRIMHRLVHRNYGSMEGLFLHFTRIRETTPGVRVVSFASGP